MKILSTLARVALFGVIFGVGFSSANAASLYIDPPTANLNRGDSVTLSVRLDTDEAIHECVNSVDAVITYSDNIEPIDVSLGDSIFSLWVEQPTINKEDHTITFAGGVPNGYCGRVAGDPRLSNILTKIVFRSPGFVIGTASDSNQAEVSFTDDSTAYLNDGYGTKAKLTTYGATFTLNPRGGASIANDWQEQVNADDRAPEAFTIELIGPAKESGGKYYIVFNTTDKQTGVDHYEVMEEELTQVGAFQWGRADAPWIVARSPYVLKDQSLNSIIRVKAIDKAGNEYIANLVPDESARTLSRDQVTTIAVVAAGLVLLLAVGVVVWQLVRRRRRKKETALAVEEELEYEDEYEDDDEVTHDQ